MNNLSNKPTKKAEAWASVAASELKTMKARNPYDIYIMGTCYPDQEMDMEMNDDPSRPVIKGIAVMYGPFKDEEDAYEFIAGYNEEWPGDHDWMIVNPGTPFLLTSYVDPTNYEYIENKGHEFQGQALVRENRRKAAEAKELAARKLKLEKLSSKNDSENKRLQPASSDNGSTASTPVQKSSASTTDSTTASISTATSV